MFEMYICIYSSISSPLAMNDSKKTPRPHLFQIKHTRALIKRSFIFSILQFHFVIIIITGKTHAGVGGGMTSKERERERDQIVMNENKFISVCL